MARIVLLNSAQTRMPFPGVAAFYHALRRGTDGAGPNPLFYVSNSPWNLYDLLDEFIDINGFPVGPLLLQSWGRSRALLAGTSLPKLKLDRVRLLFDLYPSLPFVLIGDSGERDPEIYRDIARSYPGRVRAIYIRHVHTPARAATVAAIAADLQSLGVPLILARDTVLPAEHAADEGMIDPASLPAIRADVAREERLPRPLLN
jgi:phosphatidate phosphatase APP1